MTIFPSEHNGMVLSDRSSANGFQEASVFAAGSRIYLGAVRYLARTNEWLAMVPKKELDIAADGAKFAAFDDAMEWIRERSKP